MDEKRASSQISSPQPCFPQTSLRCDFCDGTNELFPYEVHTRGCQILDFCLGYPLCPIIVQHACLYCEDGYVNFDYAFVKVGLLYSRKKDNFKIGDFAKLNRAYKSILIDFNQEHFGGIKTEFGIRYLQDFFICSTFAWTVEESFVIIEQALKQASIDAKVKLHDQEPNKIMYVKRVFGMIESSRESKYYQPSIGRKYLERYEARQINAVHDSQEE